MRLAFSIALKFLFASKAQTILIVTAIAIGISVQLFIGLLIQGLQQDLIDGTIGSSSHITVQVEDEYINENDEIITILKDKEEINKVSLVLQQNLLMNYDETDYAVLVNGINYDEKSDIYKLEEKMIKGRLPQNDNEIIIGITFENIKEGDTVNLVSTDSSLEHKVVGIFDYGVTSVNERYIYTTLDSLQNYLGRENQISTIETQVEDVFATEEIKANLKVNDKYKITTWQETNADLLTALSSQSVSSYIIQVFVMISVVLAITSVLIISVVQKSKQIGILKAMGLNDKGIASVFISQGFILGAIGSLVGLLLAIFLIESFSAFALDESGNSVINIKYNILFILLSLGIGISSAVIASLIPAYKSKKLTAMEVISNG